MSRRPPQRPALRGAARADAEGERDEPRLNRTQHEVLERYRDQIATEGYAWDDTKRGGGLPRAVQIELYGRLVRYRG